MIIVEKIQNSRRYCLLQNGYRLGLVFLRLFQKIYAALTAGLPDRFRGEISLPTNRIGNLDKL